MKSRSIIIFCSLILFSCSVNYKKQANDFFQQKNYIKTIEIASKGLSVKEDTFLYRLRGLSFYELKYYNEALNDFNYLILKGTNNEIIEKSIYCNYNIGKNELAILGFSDLIRKDSTNADYYYCQAVAYRNIKEYNKALQGLVKSTRIDGSYAYKAYNEVGLIYQVQNDYKKSIQQFTESIKLDSFISETYFNRGVSYAYLNMYDEALSDLNNAINLNNKSGVAYYNRAIVYMFQGNKEKSCSDLKAAIDLKYNEIDPKLRTYCDMNPLEKKQNTN